MDLLRRRLDSWKEKVAGRGDGDGWVQPSNAVTRAIYGSSASREEPMTARPHADPLTATAPEVRAHFVSEAPLLPAVPTPEQAPLAVRRDVPEMIDGLGDYAPAGAADLPLAADVPAPPVHRGTAMQEVPALIDGLDDLPQWTPGASTGFEPTAGENEEAA